MTQFDTASVGIEIGKGTIKAASGVRTKKRWHIRSAVIEETPPAVFKADDSLVPEIAGEVLERLFRKNRLGGSGVRVALNTDKAITRERLLPMAGLKDLSGMAKFEIEPYLPYDLEDFIVDYRILEIQKDKSGGRALRTLIAAIPRTLAESYLETARRGGIKIRSIQIYSDCLALYMSGFNPFPEENLLLADIGSHSTRLTLFRKGRYFAAFTSELGGAAATRMLADQNGLDLTEADVLKIDKGIALADDLRRREGSDTGSSPMMNRYCDALADDLSRVSDFFRTRKFSGMVDRVLLTGGGSGIADMDTYLQERIGLRVTRLDKPMPSMLSEHPNPVPTETFRRLIPAIGAACGRLEAWGK